MRNLQNVASRLSGLGMAAMMAAWIPAVLAQTHSREPVSITTPSAPQGEGSTLSDEPKVSKADRKLYVKLAEGNLAELAAARQALSKSNDEQIKSFAQHMLDDHGMALDQLGTLARNGQVELPSEPDDKHRRLVQRQADLSAIDFNKQYAQAAVTDHRTALKLLDRITSRADDVGLKSLAEKMKPQVQAHLKMALELTGSPAR